MDKINERILRELKSDARISNVDLADRVGLSASACLRRVQELERSGVITGYRAVLNPAKMNIGCTAYIAVGLSDHTKVAQLEFEQGIKAIDQIRECHNVSGAFEYLLRVETQDLATYKTLHSDVIGSLPRVRSITTYIVMESCKDDRA
ncbi:Leucine-responsive regulatory protein [Sinobacterium norvegicum]|uniref:Leucine-responsive regulatory protein n=1 Tax=Sinobacterium norvegicum TaxID=1641715 RepID=A0ABN8ED98_9GAMM|nr:Lrp/AsnC family transcriptional regulator [Sinobacterium norvegicum]CAH0990226.1 Leucine-responsive regulatory protein [Sinobacterium norvegicum]